MRDMGPWVTGPLLARHKQIRPSAVGEPESDVLTAVRPQPAALLQLRRTRLQDM